MGIEEREEVQAKGFHNIFNKLITENFTNLEKSMPLRYRMPPGHQTDLTKIELPHFILSFKQEAKDKRKNIEGYKSEKIKTNNIQR
jgi:hypothetical protein